MCLLHRTRNFALLFSVVTSVTAFPASGASLSDSLLQQARQQLESVNAQYSALMVKLKLRKRMFDGTMCKLSTTPEGNFRVDDWNSGFLGLFRDRALEGELDRLYAELEAADPESGSATVALNLLSPRIDAALERYRRQARLAQGLVTALPIAAIVVAAVLIVRRQKRRTQAAIAALAGPVPPSGPR
jgi:hypothetical protein